MKVTIFGTGYVGLVTGACLADSGHQVTCVDIDEKKIEGLKKGILPIYEPGLENIVLGNHSEGRLHFTTDAKSSVESAELIYIAAGTPPQEDGSADLQHVLKIATTIGEHMNNEKLVIVKSTVPVGTSDKVQQACQGALDARNSTIKFHSVSNPEFLKEGAAVADFMKPDRIIIGCNSDFAQDKMRECYAPFNRNHDKLIFMDIRSSELTKYAANALLATKISFMNEMANIAEELGADIENVRKGIGSDPRIGYHFIYPGCGYGGSCFPKDVKALLRSSTEAGVPSLILDAVEAANQRQKSRLCDKVQAHFGQDLSGKTFALWGLAFKPETDDMREAASLTVLRELFAAGASVKAYDPIASEEAAKIIGQRDDFSIVADKDAALDHADALIICTEWKAFRAPDFEQLKSRLNNAVIFDGRNLYEPSSMREHGFTYYAIGRGDSVNTAN